MVENSKIEWTDHTHNEWIGCAKVSPGCEHCYAETLMDTRYGRVKWGVNGTRVLTSEANRRKPFSWDRAAKKSGVRYRVFCSSLSDVFENRNELIPWRQRLFHTISQTPNLDWLILTKRPENVMHFAFQQQLWWPSDSIPENIWIGTSVENQKAADERIPHLLNIPAAVRFLSAEPLLGPLDLSPWFDWTERNFREALSRILEGNLIHWVIVGGESGHDARPMHPEWVRSIRDQCQAAGVAFFFKQWGEWWPLSQGCGDEDSDAGKPLGFVRRDGQCTRAASPYEPGCPCDCIPGEAPVIRIGKKAAGRLLDGREWSEFPSSLGVTGG